MAAQPPGPSLDAGAGASTILPAEHTNGDGEHHDSGNNKESVEHGRNLAAMSIPQSSALGHTQIAGGIKRTFDEYTDQMHGGNASASSAMSDFATIALATQAGDVQPVRNIPGGSYGGGYGDTEWPAKRVRSATPPNRGPERLYSSHGMAAATTPMPQVPWGASPPRNEPRPGLDFKQQSEVELLLNFSRTAVMSPTSGDHTSNHYAQHGPHEKPHFHFQSRSRPGDGHLQWVEISRDGSRNYHVPPEVKNASDVLGILQPHSQPRQNPHHAHLPATEYFASSLVSQPPVDASQMRAQSSPRHSAILKTEFKMDEDAMEVDLPGLLVDLSSQVKKGRGPGRKRKGKTKQKPANVEAKPRKTPVPLEKAAEPPTRGFDEDFKSYFRKDVLARDIWSTLYDYDDVDVQTKHSRQILNAHNAAAYFSRPSNASLFYPCPKSLQVAEGLQSGETISKTDLQKPGTSVIKRRNSITQVHTAPDLGEIPALDWLKGPSRARRLSLPTGLGNGYEIATPLRAELLMEDVERDENGQITLCGLCDKTAAPNATDAESAVSWINCDGCQRWFHILCAGFSEEQVKTIGKFSCPDCVKKHGPTTYLRKSGRAHAAIDYARLNQGVIESNEEEPDHPYVQYLKDKTFKFLPDKYPRLRADQVTAQYFESEGIWTEPLVIPAFANPPSSSAPAVPRDSESMNKVGSEDFVLDVKGDGLDMVMPSDLTVRDVANLYGTQEKVEVIDVKNQGEDGYWNMGRWADYYESRHKKVIRNVISLEISYSKLGKLVRRPKIVRDLDLVDSVWPPELKAKGIFPKVQLYCLMSVENSYTDFHVDFGGSSVFYHILRGKKTFLFIPPRPKNLKKYEQWCLSPQQNNTFLAGQTNECVRVDLSAGDTMLIPSGWIHAVWTPEDSLVIGGNFLTRLNYGMQIEIARIEKTTKVPNKFRYPNFQKIMWFTLQKYLRDDPIPAVVLEALQSGETFDRSRFEPDRKPGSVTYNARDYSRSELDALPELARFLLRTALIAAGKLTDGITMETQRRVDSAIPKGHGEPLELMRLFAVWIAWKRTNERIPLWAIPESHPLFEKGEGIGGLDFKLSAADMRRLDKPIPPTSRDRPLLDPVSIALRNAPPPPPPEPTVTHVPPPILPLTHVPPPMYPVSNAPPIAREFMSLEKSASPNSHMFFEPPTNPFAALASEVSDSLSVGDRSASPSGRHRKQRVVACEKCRRSRRKCIHDEFGNVDPEKSRLAAIAKEHHAEKKRRSIASQGSSDIHEIQQANDSTAGQEVEDLPSSIKDEAVTDRQTITEHPEMDMDDAIVQSQELSQKEVSTQNQDRAPAEAIEEPPEVDDALSSSASTLSSLGSIEPHTEPTSKSSSIKDPSPTEHREDENSHSEHREDVPSPLQATPKRRLPEATPESSAKRRKSARESKQVERFVPQAISVPKLSPLVRSPSKATMTPGRSPSKTPVRTPKKSVSPKDSRKSLSKTASPLMQQQELDAPKSESETLLEIIRMQEFGLRRRG